MIGISFCPIFAFKIKMMISFLQIILLIFSFVLAASPISAQGLLHSLGPVSLSARAEKLYLSDKGNESLALYQTAINNAEREYGPKARAVGALYYEMGVRALALSKFNLAERCLKKAVEINPNCETAQLMLVQLLRLRDRDGEAYNYAQQAVKKHWNSKSARRDLMLCLQETNPVAATQQAFFINCLQSGSLDKIRRREHPSTEKLIKSKPEVKKTETSEKSAKPTPRSVITKPVVKPTAVSKPTTKSKSTSTPEAASPISNKKTKSRKSGKSTKSADGLVPPPPPPSFSLFSPPKAKPSPAPAPISTPAENEEKTELKAKAHSLKLEKASKKEKLKATKAEKGKAQPKQESKQAKAESASEPVTQTPKSSSPFQNDPDFLLEWAGKNKK